MPPKKKMSPAPLPPPSLREELGIPPSVTDTEMQDLLRPPLVEMPMPEYTFGSQNIGPTAIRAGSGVVGGILQGVGGPLGSLGSAASTALGEDLAQRAEVYEGIRESPDLARVGTAGLMGAIPFPALRTATPLVREAGQAAFNTALPVGMVAAENAIEGRPQSAAELGTAGGLGLLTHGAMRGAGVGIGTLLSRGHVRPQVAIEGFPMETALGSEAGAAVYHGTPHTWPPEPEYPIGRPTLEKVRTGTGGMAQGHGFYVAQSPKVGEYYQNLSEGARDIYIGGQKLEESNPLYYELQNQMNTNPNRSPQEILDQIRSNYNSFRQHPEYYGINSSKIEEVQNALDEASKSGLEFKTTKGNLYTLDLPDEHLDKMLDWDKPLNQQPPEVQKVILPLVNKFYKGGKPDELPFNVTGRDFYEGLAEDLGPKNYEGYTTQPNPEAASQLLLSKGIIGNKYLDQASRGPDIEVVKQELEKAKESLRQWETDYAPGYQEIAKEGAKQARKNIAHYERILKEESGKKLTYNLVLFDPSLATPIARNNEPVPLSTLTGTGKPTLPPDVKHMGAWPGQGEMYNLILPDGTETTFMVPHGVSFDKQLADTRKNFVGKHEQGGLKDILGNQKGMAAIGEPEPLPVTPARLSREVQSDPGYVYHATNAERLSEIAASGKLKPHRPNYGTDQSSWPDRGTESRSYFSRKADVVWQFAPEDGTPVLIRTRETPDLRTESTGDVYSRKPIPTSKLEYLGSDGNWHSLGQRIKP